MKKENRGITLIALVITIVILLILAGVTIGMLTGNNGIVRNSNDATERTEIASEKEILDVATVNAMGKEFGGHITKKYLDEELNKILGKDKYNSEETEEGIIVTYIDSKRSYLVDTNGNVEKYIKKEPEIADVKVVKNSNGLGQDVPDKSQPEGTELYISFTAKIEDGTIIKVSYNENTLIAIGERYVLHITQNGKYEFKITGKIQEKEYTKIYTINVDKYKITLKIGDYVEYNVTYTDIYSNYEFTSNDGWRVLSPGTENSDGTYTGVKIISTGVPANLYYDYISISEEKWKASDQQCKDYFNKFGLTNSNIYNNSRTAAGLYYNFKLIEFTPGDSPKKNKAGYKKINGKETEFITGQEFLINGISEEVHNLTLGEINIARNESDLQDTTSVSVKDAAKGLFRLKDLENYNYATNTYSNYWLATPYIQEKGLLYYIYSYGNIYNHENITLGIRPVITLSSNTKINIVNK